MKLHKTQYHIVWVTRFRRKILVEGVAKYLQVKLRAVQKYYPDWHFTEIGIDKDHVHVHMVIPPKYSVSFASRALREKFRFLDRCTGIAAESGQKAILCPRWELPKRSSDGTWPDKVRKTRDKRSLNSERTPPVKAGESIFLASCLVFGEGHCSDRTVIVFSFSMSRSERIERLIAAIPELSDYRLQLIDRIVRVFALPRDYSRLQTSGLISERILEDFGDVLRLHHCFSREPFSKDKFEYALENVLKTDGIDAALAQRGQRGYDLRIKGENFSLKTEAANAIRLGMIHISKFMELGGGQWGNNPADLIGLRGQFLTALSGIQRFLILRALRKGTPDYFYELVEIPKALFEKVNNGRFVMMSDSEQFPKPGYCYVEEDGTLLYSLYFDGGGKRKLQIKALRKDLCMVHASWRFNPPTDTL